MRRVSKDILIELNKTKCINDISKELDVHRDTVRRWFKLYKIKARFKNGQSPRTNGKEVAIYALSYGEDQAMRRYGKTKKQIYACVWKYKGGHYV